MKIDICKELNHVLAKKKKCNTLHNNNVYFLLPLGPAILFFLFSLFPEIET